MRKLLGAMTVAAILSGSGTCMAAAGFQDVPSDHWACDALNKLQTAGIIKGYDDAAFRGNEKISRYEMAVLVEDAIDNRNKADHEQKELIEKLQTEYHQELEQIELIDARVKKVEKKVGGMNGKIYLSGRTIVKFDTRKVDEVNSNHTARGERYMRMQLDAHAQIPGSDWAAHISTESNKPFSNSVDDHSYLDSFGVKNLTADGPLGKGLRAKIGTDWYALGYSTLYEERVRGGIWFDFGKQLKTELFYGKAGDYGAGGYSSWMPFDIYGVTFSGALSKVTNAKFTYMGSRNSMNPGMTNPDADGVGLFDADKPLLFVRKAWELGFDTKFARDFSLTAAYSQSNASRDNKNYLMTLQYKTANPYDAKGVGSYDLWLRYAREGERGTFAPGNDILANEKGWQVGFDYVPAPNCLLTAFYYDRRYINDYSNGTVSLKSGSKDTFYRVQMQYFFW